MTIHHQGEEPKFVMSITGRFKTCLNRLEDEATRTRESEADILMNSKMQWHQPPINRVVVFRGNVNDDQIGAAPLPNVRGRGRGRGRGGRGNRGTA
jgi:hypothetical protein